MRFGSVAVVAALAIAGCGSQRSNTTVVHHHYYASDASSAAAEATSRISTRTGVETSSSGSRPAIEPEYVLDALASLLDDTYEAFREQCASAPAGTFEVGANGVTTCWQEESEFALSVTYLAGSAVIAGFTTGSERIRELATAMVDQLGDPDRTGTREMVWERDQVVVKLGVSTSGAICGVYVYRKGSAV